MKNYSCLTPFISIHRTDLYLKLRRQLNVQHKWQNAPRPRLLPPALDSSVRFHTKSSSQTPNPPKTSNRYRLPRCPCDIGNVTKWSSFRYRSSSIQQYRRTIRLSLQTIGISLNYMSRLAKNSVKEPIISTSLDPIHWILKSELNT